jgi:hypothetical protein
MFLLQLARKIADLTGSEDIQFMHFAEALAKLSEDSDDAMSKIG